MYFGGVKPLPLCHNRGTYGGGVPLAGRADPAGGGGRRDAVQSDAPIEERHGGQCAAPALWNISRYVCHGSEGSHNKEGFQWREEAGHTGLR